jgi:hypothetical protein
MKKLMLLAALLAMVVVAAVPALAQRNHHPHNGGGGGEGISQANEQDVESGDSSQTINVAGGGDNSNSCQNVQGISNTGNAVTNTGVLQYASPDSQVEVDDSGNFTISPSSSTTCDQKVNQAASASGN